MLPKVCEEQLFPLDMETYQLTFAHKNDVIPGIQDVKGFPKRPAQTLKVVEHVVQRQTYCQLAKPVDILLLVVSWICHNNIINQLDEDHQSNGFSGSFITSLFDHHQIYPGKSGYMHHTSYIKLIDLRTRTGGRKKKFLESMQTG